MGFTMPAVAPVAPVEGSPIALMQNALTTMTTTVPSSLEADKTTVATPTTAARPVVAATNTFKILNPRQLLPITYLPTSLAASGAILSPQIISTATRLPILASPTAMLGVNPQLGAVAPQVIALNQLPTGDAAATAGVQMITIQLPQKLPATTETKS